MSPSAPKASSRIAAIMLDVLILQTVCGVLGFVVVLGPELIDTWDWNELEGIRWILILFIGLLLCKDVLKGQSPGKRIMHLQVVRKDSELAVGSFRTLLRNLSSLVWPVELVWTIVQPSRRLGDLIAGTEVRKVEGRGFDRTAPLWQAWAAFVVTIAVGSLLIRPVTSPFDDASEPTFEIVPQAESLHPAQSQALAEALRFKMGSVFEEITAEVYERSGHGETGLIRVYFLRRADKPIETTRLYYFREMLIEICEQTVPASVSWPGEMQVVQETEFGRQERSLYW